MMNFLMQNLPSHLITANDDLPDPQINIRSKAMVHARICLRHVNYGKEQFHLGG